MLGYFFERVRWKLFPLPFQVSCVVCLFDEGAVGKSFTSQRPTQKPGVLCVYPRFQVFESYSNLGENVRLLLQRLLWFCCEIFSRWYISMAVKQATMADGRLLRLRPDARTSFLVLTKCINVFKRRSNVVLSLLYQWNSSNLIKGRVTVWLNFAEMIIRRLDNSFIVRMVLLLLLWSDSFVTMFLSVFHRSIVVWMGLFHNI